MGHIQVRRPAIPPREHRTPPPDLPLSSDVCTCPKKTQAEGKFRRKKLIHKQATQGARTGNLSPSVKPSSPWRQEAAHYRHAQNNVFEVHMQPLIFSHAN